MSDDRVCIYKCQCKEMIFVDILMLVYNHEKFIDKAIKSILMQQTQFSYRIIIGEDCSTDSTREVIMDYYLKYPDKFELYLWKKNVGMEENALKLMKECRGKYVAYLEGDDYWTDPLKLEKQISFLEKNQEYIGSVHNVRCVDENGGILHNSELYPIQEEHIYGIEQASRGEMASQTASLIYRNFHIKWKEKDWRLYMECMANGDFKWNILLGYKGDIYYFRDIMADHRRIFKSGDSWTARTNGKNMIWIIYLYKTEVKKYIEEFLKISSNWEISLDEIFKESCMKVFCKLNFENIYVCWKLFHEKIRMKRNSKDN